MFRAWRLFKEEMIRERELEQIEMHERLLSQIEQRISHKGELRTKMKALKSLKKHVQMSQDERLIEEQHLERKT